MEVWKNISEKYAVSNSGLVKNRETGKMLTHEVQTRKRKYGGEYKQHRVSMLENGIKNIILSIDLLLRHLYLTQKINHRSII